MNLLSMSMVLYQNLLENLRYKLYNHSTASYGEEWTPEVFHGILGVDMTNITKPERDSCDRDRDGKKRCGDGPTQPLCPIEEFFARRDIPADLNVH